jgi:hypothetical protein
VCLNAYSTNLVPAEVYFTVHLEDVFFCQGSPGFVDGLYGPMKVSISVPNGLYYNRKRFRKRKTGARGHLP